MSQTRRQNSACDQCRNRKVKCNIQPGEANCQHCVNKNYQCTFIAQQETEKKRSVTGRRLVRNSPPNMPIKLPPGYHQYRPPSAEYLAQDGIGMNGREDYAVSNARGSLPVASGSTGPTPYIMGVMDPALQNVGPLPHVMSGPVPNPWPPSRAASQIVQDRSRMGPPYPGATPYAYVPRTVGPAPAQYPYPGLPPPPNAPIQDFLAYLFSPDPSQVNEAVGATAAQTQEYILARRRLQEPEYRIEFATELIEVYFQVYHPRVPIVNPTRFRAQFREALYGPQKDRNGLSSTSSSFDGPPVKRARADESGPVSASSSFDSIATTSTAATASTSHSAPASTPATPITSSSLRPIHRPLLACLLAWGSKFSDHALLVMDRRQVSREASPLRSNISRLLVDRAREIAEQEKVFRVAKPENVVVCLLMEPVQPLQSYPATDPQGIKCLWSNAAIRHLVELGVNHHPANPVPAGQHDGDPDDWGCMVFCWWICVVADALCGLYFKKKPALSQDDYDLKEFKLVTQPAETPARPDGVPLDPAQERAQAQETAFNILKTQFYNQVWYQAAHDLAVCARHLAKTLWTPIVMKWGIPYDVIVEHTTALSKWRDDHLAIVGANNDLQNIGDYVAAVSACTIDCSYHVMWITLSQAITEYGIKEVNAAVDAARAANPPPPTATVDGTETFEALKEIPADVTHMVDVERTVATEAFKSSTRISGLAGVLTSNGYMRLDPNAMHWPIYSAGRLLAELGRQEVFNCIDGLNQNGYAYDESWKHAEELQALYQTSLIQGPRDSEALLHPYLTAEPRATRANAAPNLRKKGAVFEAYKHNVDGPFTVDGLKRKHSPDATD